MIGNLLLRFHARKSTHPMKDFYSKSDFALILATEDGYMSPYCAPNGFPYRYDANNQTLIEIDGGGIGG